MMMVIDASNIVRELTEMIEEQGEGIFVRARDVLNQLFAAKIVPQEAHKEIVCPKIGARKEGGMIEL